MSFHFIFVTNFIRDKPAIRYVGAMYMHMYVLYGSPDITVQ